MNTDFAAVLVSSASPDNTYEVAREAYRNQLIKVLLMLVLGICFWYAVPYRFPLRLDPDALHAASSEAQSYEGNVSRQVALPVVLVTSLFALYRLPRVGVIAKRSRLLWSTLAYLGWILASAFWSVDPALSCKRLVVFAIDAAFVVALIRRTTIRESAILGLWCTSCVAIIALVADVFLLHTFAPLNPDYRFMGVMTANYQAINLFVGLACALTLLQQRPRSPILLACTTALSLLLLLTRARIGAILFVLMAVLVSMRMARRSLLPHARALAVTAVLALIVPVAVFEVGNSGSSVLMNLFMMGRQDTENTASLSNRAPLWAELVTSVADRPVLGYGFESFWTAERVERISMNQGWVVPHAHNTYLDQSLSVGLIGAALYAGVLWSALFVAWRRYRRTQNEMDFFPVLLLSWLALLSVTESLPLAPNLPSLIAYSCVPRMFTNLEPDAVDAELAYSTSTSSKGHVWSASA